MLAHTDTVAFHGIDVLPIDVQAQVANRLPADAVAESPALDELGLGGVQG
jgi:hypothetical protein